MPVVGTTAYNTAGQITSLVRSLLNDAAGNLFTDAVLLPYVNSAYRKAQRALANVQSGTFLSDDVLLVGAGGHRGGRVRASLDHGRDRAAEPVAAGPARAGEIVGAREPQLRRFRRDDGPDRSRRLAVGAAGDRRCASGNGAPTACIFSAPRRTRRSACATRNRFPISVDATSPVLIRNAQEALAYAAAAMAGAARGAPQAERWDAAAADALEDLVVRATQREQQTGRRRRPFSASAGFAPLI